MSKTTTCPPLWFFSPFATGKDKKMRKEKTRIEFFSPFLPHVQSCSWALSYVGCKNVRRNTSTSLSPLEVNMTCPLPLVFSFLCLHFMGHVCVDLTIAFRRRWARPSPSPFKVFSFLCWHFKLPSLYAVLFLYIVLCRSQQRKEECVNHRLWRWARPAHPLLVLLFTCLCCCVVLTIVTIPTFVWWVGAS